MFKSIYYGEKFCKDEQKFVRNQSTDLFGFAVEAIRLLSGLEYRDIEIDIEEEIQKASYMEYDTDPNSFFSSAIMLCEKKKGDECILNKLDFMFIELLTGIYKQKDQMTIDDVLFII